MFGTRLIPLSPLTVSAQKSSSLILHDSITCFISIEKSVFFIFDHYFVSNLYIMTRDGRSVTIHSCLMGDYPSVYFHTGDEPGYLKGLTIDEDWKTADFDVFQLTFSPSAIRSFSERPLIIPFTDIASTILDTVFSCGLTPRLSLIK